MEDIRSKCIEVFSIVFEVDPSIINDETSPDNLAEWDSLAHVQLILKLQEAFEIEISPDVSIELETFEMVLTWLKDNLKN